MSHFSPVYPILFNDATIHPTAQSIIIGIILYSSLFSSTHQEVQLVLPPRHILHRTFSHHPHCYQPGSSYHQIPPGPLQEPPNGLPASTLPPLQFILHITARVIYGKHIQIILLPCSKSCKSFPVCVKFNSTSQVWHTWCCFLLLLHLLFYSLPYSSLPITLVFFAVPPPLQSDSLFRAFTMLSFLRICSPHPRFFTQLSPCHSSLYSDVTFLGNISNHLHTTVTLTYYLRKSLSHNGVLFPL